MKPMDDVPPRLKVEPPRPEDLTNGNDPRYQEWIGWVATQGVVACSERIREVFGETHDWAMVSPASADALFQAAYKQAAAAVVWSHNLGGAELSSQVFEGLIDTVGGALHKHSGMDINVDCKMKVPEPEEDEDDG